MKNLFITLVLGLILSIILIFSPALYGATLTPIQLKKEFYNLFNNSDIKFSNKEKSILNNILFKDKIFKILSTIYSKYNYNDENLEKEFLIKKISLEFDNIYPDYDKRYRKKEVIKKIIDKVFDKKELNKLTFPQILCFYRFHEKINKWEMILNYNAQQEFLPFQSNFKKYINSTYGNIITKANVLFNDSFNKAECSTLQLAEAWAEGINLRSTLKFIGVNGPVLLSGWIKSHKGVISEEDKYLGFFQKLVIWKCEDKKNTFYKFIPYGKIITKTIDETKIDFLESINVNKKNDIEYLNSKQTFDMLSNLIKKRIPALGRKELKDLFKKQAFEAIYSDMFFYSYLSYKNMLIKKLDLLYKYNYKLMNIPEGGMVFYAYWKHQNQRKFNNHFKELFSIPELIIMLRIEEALRQFIIEESAKQTEAP